MDNKIITTNTDKSVLSKTTVEQGIDYAEFHISRQYMSDLSLYPVIRHEAILDQSGNQIDEYSNVRLYRINSIVLDKDENTTDKLASVYGAVHSIRSSILLIIKSTSIGIEFYLGIKNNDRSSLSAATAGTVLQSALKSNFPGSDVSSVKTSETKDIMEQILKQQSEQSVSSVAINPSLRDNDKEHFVQGLEKFMDAFSGKNYIAFLIAEPLDKSDVETNKRGFEELYSVLSHFSETTLAYGTSESKSVTENISRTFSEAINQSVSRSNGGSNSSGTTSSYGSSSNSSVTDNGIFKNTSTGYGSTSSYGSTQTTGTNWSDTMTSGNTRTAGDTSGKSYGTTTGETKNITVKHIDKMVTRLLERLDEQLDHISSFESYGMWSCSAYFVSSDIQTSVAAANTFRALVLGDETRTEAFVNTWDIDNSNTQKLLEYISLGKHPIIKLPEMNRYMSQSVKPTSLVSGKELPIFIGLPRFSLKGIMVNSMASFGRAVNTLYKTEEKNTLRLGCVVHKGVTACDTDRQISKWKLENIREGKREDDDLCYIKRGLPCPLNNPVPLNIQELTSHCFITGSTGSGKSNTTYHLLEKLIDHNINFLVIEPKKGEYKDDFGGLKDINIFWTNKDKYSFLHINPFSFPKNIHVIEHMDRLIEIFSACWPLHNAMPAFLRSATERCYISCGWDLLNSRHFDVGKPMFPTFKDLLEQLPIVIRGSEYSAQAKGDYEGALKTRVSDLTNGIMGQVFNSGYEIEDKVLFDENTIIDLSRVGASETKSLIMGIIVMKLNEYRISCGGEPNRALRHITVIEEAHNLLRRVSTEQNGDSANVAGKSVEMISNSIAEMRTYGEGFFIVDQSPTSVDISAIKNTNTKIVMRLPEMTDIETIGNAFSLSIEQKNEIAKLPRGRAIVSQSGWVEPVMVKIEQATGKFKEKNTPAQTDVRGVLLSFIKAVLEQADKQYFVDKKIKDIFRENQLSQTQSEELLRIYHSFVSQSASVTQNQQERAAFIIRVIGCGALPYIYPFVIKENETSETIRSSYIKWKKTLFVALDEYVLNASMDDKTYIIKQLVLIQAKIENNPVYKKLISVIKGNK
jgi:hypothetical protein